MNKENYAYIPAIAAVLLWSTAATAFKITLKNSNPETTLLLSTFSSFFVLLLVCFLFHEDPLRSFTPYSLILGLLNPTAYYLLLFKGYSLLPAQTALTLNYLWAIIITILSIPLLKQKIKPEEIGALFISFFGMALIVTKGDLNGFQRDSSLGLFYIVLSSFIWALYWIYNQKASKSPLSVLTQNFFFGSIYSLIYYFIFPYEIKLSMTTFIGSFYIGCFEMGFTFFLWLLALKKSSNTAKISNLIFISPVLSLFWIKIIIQEKIFVSTWIGLFLILSGIIIQKSIKAKTIVK